MTSGPGAEQSLEVEQEVVIGREDADLTISDPEVSRRHALIRPIERGIEVEDLGSTNGTFVNGERISGTVDLTVGGTVRVGNSEIQVDLQLLAPTRVRDVIAAGQPTKARDVIPGVDDLTRARETPAPQPPPAPPAGQPPPAYPPPPPAQAPLATRRAELPTAALVAIVLVVAVVVAILLLFVL